MSGAKSTCIHILLSTCSYSIHVYCSRRNFLRQLFVRNSPPALCAVAFLQWHSLPPLLSAAAAALSTRLGRLANTLGRLAKTLGRLANTLGRLATLGRMATPGPMAKILGLMAKILSLMATSGLMASLCLMATFGLMAETVIISMGKILARDLILCGHGGCLSFHLTSRSARQGSCGWSSRALVSMWVMQ